MSARCLVALMVGVVAAAAVGGAGDGSATPAPPRSPDVSGTWRNPGGQALRPTSGDVPFTPWGAEQAQKDGVRDLRQSGLLKVRSGFTTLEELISVTNE